MADTSTDSGEAWTIGRLLTWTTDYFAKQQIEQPRLEAEVLLASARRCQRIELYAAFTEVAEPSVRDTFRGLVRQRSEGTPVHHLVGHREFYSLRLRVTPDVLIPRPETEDLVLAAIERLQTLPTEPPPVVVDVGTGSGNIAIALAKHGGACQITAMDISEAALAVARENVERHSVSDRVTLLKSDLLTAFAPEPRFDLIVSNPPYVTSAEMQQLPKEIREHEPHEALAAGPEGMDVITPLVAQARDRMRSGGWLLVEISSTIAASCLQLLEQHHGWEDARIMNDSAGQPRLLCARRALGS